MVATQPTSRTILGINQRAYQTLKLSLSLNLRHQLLIAVCDNGILQNQLATQLETEIAQIWLNTQQPEVASPHNPTRLARLEFDPQQPNLVMQVARWVKQQPQSQVSPSRIPSLQVLGIDQMTRQSSMLQHHFLQSLDQIETLLPHLDASLLIWLPWPWFRSIQQSATRFWQWRSAVFEFVSEPTPIGAESAAHPPRPAAAQPPENGVLYGETRLATASDSAVPYLPADLWNLISHDLYQLEAQADAAEAGPLPKRSPSLPETTAAAASPADPAERLAQLQAQQAPAEDMGQAALALGHSYRTKIETGEAEPATIEAAIAAYQAALTHLPETDEALGSALNDLGTLYWMQAQMQANQQQLFAKMQDSLTAYQQGLAKVDAQRQSDIASRLYSNIGAVHSTLAAYDSAVDHLKQAVQAYRQALPLCAIEQNADEYATLQNSLGSIYWKLAHYEQPKTYLHRAIAAYNEALRCRHPEQTPAEYAAVQNNLGIAYWSLSKQERPIFLLKHAIAAYRDALNYRTPQTDPTGCASTYNNLGTAYWELANTVDADIDPQERYRQNAVIAYEAALKAAQIAAQYQSVSLDLPSIHHCLGNIHDQLALSAPQTAATTLHLSKALHHYLTALAQQTPNAPTYDAMFNALVRNVSYHFEQLGLAGQQQALNQLPAQLLPEVMKRL
ncbi:MAG: tetratricopeptide repeat protein [Leptolyngbya sp. SIO4C1]|nr:tetratricopeptide repeat protein [Leptolyngbya sp. SIO4C1]